jgi:TctA family transporter
MILSDGSLGVFWSNPLVGSIMTLALVLVIVPQLFKLVSTIRSRGTLRSAQ